MLKELTPARYIPESACIGLFTPSEPLTESRLDRVYKQIEEQKKFSHSVRLSPNALTNTEHTAGTSIQRANDIIDLVENSDVDLLIASWGGKSSAQLLKLLDYKKIHSYRKPILAFSDGGVLLNAIYAITGLTTFYGPNVFGKFDESDFSDLLFLKEGLGYQEDSQILPEIDSFTSMYDGVAKGRLFGGNLSSYVLGVSGSRFEPDIKDGLFFWESGSKTAQELELLLTALEVRGFFDQISGMIVGHVTIKDDQKWGTRSLYEIIDSIIGHRKIPILHYPNFGHANISNPAFPIGCKATLDTAYGHLVLNESPLSY